MIGIDTNVLIYACDQADPRRQQIAVDLVTNTDDGVLLWQVACEFLSPDRKLGKRVHLEWPRATDTQPPRLKLERQTVAPTYGCTRTRSATRTAV